jgi:hypothetical protein
MSVPSDPLPDIAEQLTVSIASIKVSAMKQKKKGTNFTHGN